MNPDTRLSPPTGRFRRLVLAAVGTSLLVAAACSSEPEDPDVAALREVFGITADRAIHFVTLAGEGAWEGIDPSTLEVAPGDVVVFETGDWRVHTLAFDLEATPSDRRAFLEEFRQAASPPLLTLGSRFVVTFQDAPLGDYPFTSEAGGGSARGVVSVRVPEGR